MALILRPVDDVRDQVERLFSDLTEDLNYPSFSRSEWRPFRSLLSGQSQATRQWLPPIEVAETEQQFTIKAEVPGIQPEEIQVEMVDNSIVIQGETRQEQHDEQQNVHRSELRYGRFYRQIPLPGYVKPDSAQAEFNHGLLTLRFDKEDEQKRKKINVNVKS